MCRRAAIATLAILGGTAAVLAAQAAPPITHAGIVLLQPDEVLRARVEDASALVKYLQDVEAAAAAALQTSFMRKPNGGFLVLALRPGGGSRLWLDLESPLASPLAQAVLTAVQAVAPPRVEGGVVVLAIKVGLWGGRPLAREAPAPAEWREHAARAGRKLEIAELVEAVWPP